MVSQWIRLIECNYFEITMPMITLDSRVAVTMSNYYQGGNEVYNIYINFRFLCFVIEIVNLI